VNVLYGSAGGLQASSPDDQLWTQDTASVKGTADAEDFLGAALASSDFNSDGFFDLAIGVPFESSIDDGAANVLYGSTAGLQATSPNDQLWSQDSPSVKGTGGDQDEFGTVLAARDFNGDGFADLAVAVPFDAVETFPFAGAVNVLYGSAAGLQATSPNDQLWSQDSPSVKDTAGPDFEEFGGALAAGDLNGDGFADLGIGTPFEDVGTANQAGAVNVLYGSAAGLQATSPNDQLWSQDSPSVKDVAESGGSFGNSLTAKDFNGDGSADVAFGVPAEDGAGAVNTLYGSAAGLQATSPDDRFWTQDSPNVEDTAEAGDSFGYPLS
jgi:hypothetical protein